MDAPADPALIFDTLNAHQRSAALRGAIELDLFTNIALGHRDIPSLAAAGRTDPRATRILCDFLVIHGLLGKDGGGYRLTPTAAAFLDRAAPAYMGSVARFLNSEPLLDAFRDVAALVRTGKTTMSEHGTTEPNWDGWVEFARSMVPMMKPASQFIGALAAERWPGPRRVLDVAAGHGLFGIAVAESNPDSRVVAVDWESVLVVAGENAARAGVEDRYEPLAGDAFTVDYGSGYDLVLLTNLLHHFDRPTCVRILRKVREALAPEGAALTLEFVPDEDRISPPGPAAFSFMMLGTTPSGDAYTFSEHCEMFTEAGFGRSELIDIESSPQRVIVSSQ